MNLSHLKGLYEGARHDPLIVCHVDQAIAAALGATRGRVLLTDGTMRKQIRKHPDLTLEHYGVLPAALARGEYRQDKPDGAIVIYVDTFLGIIPLTQHEPDIEPGLRDRSALLDEIEVIIAHWEDGEGGTYRELAERIVAMVLKSLGD